MSREVIDFKTIDEHGPQSYHATFEVPVDELDRDELANVGTATIHTNVKGGDLSDEYVADGTVSFTADLNCSRCAEPYPIANTSTFHVRFRPRPEASAENEEVEITDKEELDVEFYDSRQVPVRHIAAEQIGLSLPMKTLCEETCRGLCTHCGANLNRGECGCQDNLVDSRWDALRGIRDELEKKKDA